MRKKSKMFIVLLLVIVLCFSMMPLSVMATGDTEIPGATEQAVDEDFGPIWPEVTEPNAAPASVGNTPEYKKNVRAPFAQVVYHYYDETQTQSITDFSDYAVTSTHSYYALAASNDTGITISANKYPGKLPVSTDALRFRVLLDGNEDISAQASYDAATGFVSLPGAYAGREVTVVWYCPDSEVVELPVKVTIGVYSNGHGEVTEQNLTLASNANAIEIPLSGVDRIVVNQNGLDLFEDEYSQQADTLTVNAAALGGDLVVSAFPVKNEGGFTTMGTSATTVNHERQHYNSVDYGYVTSYYVANGNVAYCLDPSVSGLNSGQYSISGYMERGTGRDNIIKAAWYLYRCPGEDSSLFAGLDWQHAYGYSHVAASYIYLETAGDSLSKAWEGIESDTAAQNRIMSIVNAIKEKPMPPTGFDCFLYNVGNPTSQSLMGWDYTPTGNLAIQKVSNNPDATDSNPCYSLQGAEFDVFDSNDNKVGTITTDADGKGKLEGLAAGNNYYIVETKPPEGYIPDPKNPKISFAITSDQTTNLEIVNVAHGDPAYILLKKQDEHLTEGKAQGGATLEGAQFTIKYYKGYYDNAGQLAGVTPARTWVFETDEDGFAMLHPDYKVSGPALYYDSTGKIVTLPRGTITVQETKAPTGYLINNELYIRKITGKGTTELVRTYNEPIIKEPPIRGGVSVQKMDFELNRPAQPQGDADLAATLDIYNRSKNSVVVNGKTFATGTIVHTMKTDAATGAATTAADLLPYGDYEVVERPGNQPTGYLNTGKTSQKFSIRQNGVIVDLKTPAGAIKNKVIRGSFYLEKWDAEINRNEAQGSGKLDAKVEIVNKSKHLVLVGGVEYQPGEVVYSMTLSEAGRYQSPDRLLPYGSYLYREIAPPSQGYLSTGVLSGTFSIREDGENVKLNTTTTALKNDPLRADLRGMKISDGDGKRLAGVPFSITSVTTGESHTVITDRNGEFNTHSSWNPHSQNTNAGLTDRDGIWFGELWTLDDSKGALLYDTYLLEEQPCEANADRELLSFEVSVYRHNATIDLGTVTNDYTQTVEIFTTARDQESTTGSAHVSEETTILDTVYYSGLVPGREYTTKGVLMDKEANAPLLIDGQQVTAEKTFKALSESSNTTMEFTFNSLELAGRNVVVYESLEYEGEEIAAHADIEDEGQTVNFMEPQIGTSAAGLTGEKEIDVLGEATIVDTVSFDGLIIGQTYTLKGVLMDRETNAPLLMDGQQVTAEKSFIPKSAAGTVDMSFTVNAALLKSKSIVVFESLEYKEREITVHADIEDEGQTVTFKKPQIGTSATGARGENEIIAAKAATIVDVVSYKNLAVGKTYTVKGILMNKATGEALLVDGEEITAETTFVAKEASGSVEVVFVFNALDLGGGTVVVFENLYYNNVEIATHADIEDEAQTVTVAPPRIGTTAKAGDGSKTIPVSQEAKVIDTVAYENLVPGEEYTLKGVLMDKSTGKAVLVDGKEVPAEKTFIAKETSGSIEVVFTFNSTGLQEKILVVFETLEYEGKEIAVHADISDAAQTIGVGVDVPAEPTNEPGSGHGAQTGRDSLPVAALIIALGAAIAGAVIFAMRKKKIRAGK